MDTKQRILYTALDMFSDKGYKGTNLRDLAGELKLSKSALYRHFTSKEDIWNSLVDELESYYERVFFNISKQMTSFNSIEDIKQMSLKQIDITMNDSTIIKVRKLIQKEQFRDEQMAEIATKHFITGLKDIYTGIFEEAMKDEILKQYDIDLLTLEYISPVTLLIHQCDRSPELKDEIYKMIESHIEFFFKVYGVNYEKL